MNNEAISEEGFTSAVARHLVGLTAATTPVEVSTRVKLSVLDWFGVAMAGAVTDPGRIAADWAVDEAGSGPSRLFLREATTSPSLAAFANGVAGHALDYDDGSYWMMGHPSVAVCPAAVALADRLNSTGAELATAVLAGFEAASLVGLAVGTSHYLAGWHATGTIGTFGAAAAAAVLLDLDVERTRHALGLAATQAAALKAMMGTMGKPFHAGRAAASGVMAAGLAKRGFRVNPEAIEAKQGFGWTASTTFFPETAFETMAGRYSVEAVSHKRHACCGGTHPTIDAIERLRRDAGFGADDVEEARIRVSPHVASMCIIDVPSSGLEGKFSLRYAAALALLGRSTGPAAFTDEAVRRPEVQAVISRVSTAPLGDVTGPLVDLELRLKDGRVFEERSLGQSAMSDEPRVPDEGLAAHAEQLTAKFRELLEPLVGKPSIDELVERLTSLDSQPSVRALTDLAATPQE